MQNKATLMGISNQLKQIRLFSVAIVSGLLVLPAAVLAQQYFDPGLLQKTIDRRPVDYQSPGVRVGSFILKPGAEIGYENNDNIFYRGSGNDNGAGKIDDDIIHYRPTLNLNSDWSRHELNISVYGDVARYNSHSREDYEDWAFKLDGRIDVKRGSNFSYALSNLQLHEDRSSPDDVRGRDPTQFSYTSYSGEYSHAFNRLTAAVAIKTDDTNYDNNHTGDGTLLSNKDRDRTRDAYKLRLEYQMSAGHSFFISAEANNVDYDQKFDNSGFERSSDGYTYRAGVRLHVTGVLTGDLHVKYFKQKYDDARFRNVDSFGLGGSLDWNPTRMTNVNFRFDRSPQATTQTLTSGYDSALYAVRVQHEVRRNILANFRFSYTDNNYQFNGNNSSSSLTNTEVARIGAGLSYLLNRNAFISGGYSYEKQNANTSFFQYKTNRWFVTLGFEF